MLDDNDIQFDQFRSDVYISEQNRCKPESYYV